VSGRGDVPLTIAEDFGPPKGTVGLWDVTAATTSVPKASINEYGNTPGWKIEIRFATNIVRM
jgi:hypothetical protein